MAKLKTAVIVGGHFYDVPAFQDMLTSLDGIAAYPQTLDNWAADTAGARQTYDATLFYNMDLPTPDPAAGHIGRRIHDALVSLPERDHGIVVLHHGLCAFREWDFWSGLVGIPDRTFHGYQHGISMPMAIAAPDHPILADVEPFTLIDETYDMADPSDGEVLLTTNVDKCMASIAWVRQQDQARVFCYQSGHDALVYGDASFQQVLRQGIRWAAGV